MRELQSCSLPCIFIVCIEIGSVDLLLMLLRRHYYYGLRAIQDIWRRVPGEEGHLLHTSSSSKSKVKPSHPLSSISYPISPSLLFHTGPLKAKVQESMTEIAMLPMKESIQCHLPIFQVLVGLYHSLNWSWNDHLLLMFVVVHDACDKMCMKM